MDSLLFIGFAIAAAFLGVLVKKLDAPIAALLSLGACAMLLLSVTGTLGEIVSAVRGLNRNARLDDAYITLLLRILGIAYAAQIGIQACRETGAAGVADHVALCAKMAILSILTPVFLSLVEMIAGVLQ